MRRIFYLLPVLLIFLLGPGFTCHKALPPGGLKGKLVINAACSHYVIQLLEGDIAPDKLMASWKNPSNDSTYTRVFTVGNVCNFSGYGLSQGDVFSFDLDDNPPDQLCDICMIFYPTPSVRNAVKNVQRIK